MADEEAVRQIFDNLIDNAIKYTPDGGSVRVSCRTQGGEVAVEVADTGIGIPRDDLPRIFERFYRVDKARSRELGGTGLGLSIVKHLIQSIGGQITVNSRLGAGSKFLVKLPRHRAQEHRDRKPDSSLPASPTGTQLPSLNGFENRRMTSPRVQRAELPSKPISRPPFDQTNPFSTAV